MKKAAHIEVFDWEAKAIHLGAETGAHGLV